MSGPGDILTVIRAALAPHGLFLRGIVHFDEDDGPELKKGGCAAGVVLLGNAGGSLWPAFSAWRVNNPDAADPLDTWSKLLIRPLAESIGAQAFFPSDPPWQPFQQWAMRAEGLRASPLGILIHPVYGLWHGYRAALAFAEPLPQVPAISGAHPCDTCLEKPCLTTCPVGAVSAARFDVAACRRHLATGQAGCLAGGCLARAACPVGVDYRYPAAQLRFHMAALGL